MIVAKYKFNPNTYANLLPEFNSEFSYTKSDVTNSDGTITRTINSDSLPTLMTFGTDNETYDRSGSLLEILDMNTSNLTSMQRMFRYCINLTNITCNWNTSKVTTMQDAFQKCTSLTSLNLSSFDTSKVTNMTSMFNGSSNLTSLDLNNWDTSQVTTMIATFLDCSSLTSLSIGDWNTSNVTNLNSTFRNCSSLVSLDLNNWNTSNVTNLNSTFRNCSSLVSLDLNNWDTSKVTDMNSMFNSCSSLTSLDLSKWDTSKVTNISSMFAGCSKLTSVDLSNWNTSNVINMSYMFDNCSSLTSLDLSNWNTSKVTTMQGMFRKCPFTSLELAKWDTSRVTNMNAMFWNCEQLTSLDLSSFNTSKVTDMSYMFTKCSSLTTLNLSNWDISQVINISNMLSECSNLYKVNLKYANQSTVSKIHENLNNRTNTTKGYVLSSVDLTSNKNWHRIKSSHNNFYLPQPLRKIGDKKDRLYWDEDKGHYCIEQMICRINISDYDWWKLESSKDGYDTFILGNFNSNAPYFPTTWGGRVIVSDDSVITLDAIHLRMKYPSSRFNGDVEKFKEYCLSNGVYALLQRYGTDKAITIDLPHLNRKLTFDSYNPSTTIDIPNRPLKASKTYLDVPIARYRYINLQPNAQYNVQFDCKGDSGIKVNLGGTEVTFTPTSEWARKNLTITTPSELVNDKLSISNVGITSNNIVDNVMLFSEVIAQEPDYIDAIQSIGELQSNGTYNLDISTKYGDRVSTHSIYLPQPLRKIGDLKDRLYWDENKGHYCIEQNIGQVVLDGGEDEDWNITGSSSIDRINTMVFRLSEPMMGSVYNIKCDKFITCSRENSCYSTDNEGVEGIGGEPYYLCLGIKKSKLPTQDVAGLRQWLSSNPTTVLYVLVVPNIIDLPEMNKKLSYDTYLPNTSIDVTNLPLQPYGLLLEDDTVRYKSTIEPSTLYTIQFNCLAKSTTNLTLDLGGTRVTVDPIIGVNHVQITTPSELTSDRLFLIGTGIIVKEVIVNKGNMNQYPKYFDGEQSVGELQEDGSYIIRISTDNYTGLWEGDL